MRKFNIGDKIKVIGNCNGHGYEIGGEYTIKCFDSFCIEHTENGYAYNLDANVHFDVIREKDMELVKPKEYIDYCNNNVSVLKTTKIIVDNLTNEPNVLSQDEMNKFYDRYVKGVWNIDMKNEVLELWYTRKHNKIMNEYEEKEREFNNSKELVIKYKEIVERFENELEGLYRSEENIEKVYIIDELTESMYKYKINYDKLNDEFLENYVAERDEKLHELNELRKEINAQLSLSSELDYQIEVLTTYGILDKKTKRMVD